jgi:hypothetical protein
MRQIKNLRRKKNAVRVTKTIQNMVCELMINRHKTISVGAYSNDVCDPG